MFDKMLQNQTAACILRPKHALKAQPRMKLFTVGTPADWLETVVNTRMWSRLERHISNCLNIYLLLLIYIFLFLLLLVLYKSDDVKGIPEFWLTAMKNVDMLADMIQVCVAFVVHPSDFQCDQHLIFTYGIHHYIAKQMGDKIIKNHQLGNIEFSLL